MFLIDRGIDLQKSDQNEKSKQNIIPFIPEGDFFFTKGMESFDKGNFTIAVKWLRKAIEQDPDDPVYQSQLAIIYSELGKYNKSNALLFLILEQYGNKYIECHYLLASNYANAGQFDKAKKHASIYLKHEPNGDFSEEAESLITLFDDTDIIEYKDKELYLFYLDKIFQHMDQNEWKKALSLLEKLYELNPNKDMLKYYFALALFFSGDQERAMQEGWKLFIENPSYLMNYLNLAIFYYELNDPDRSKFMVNVLQNVYPIHEMEKFLLAIVMAKTKNFAEACARFRTLTDPSVTVYVSYYKWYSYSAYHSGKVKLANQIWKKACQQFSHLHSEFKPWETD